MILQAAKYHPVTAKILVEVGLFKNIRLAQRRLQKLARRGKVRYIGQAYLDETMQKVFYRGQPFPTVWIEHEVEITEILIRMSMEKFQRSNVPFDCDWLMWINGDKYYGERHRGTHNAKGMKKRVDRLKELVQSEPDAILLWVCNDESDIERLKEDLAEILPACLFTTYEEALTPHSAVWKGVEGVPVPLPKHGRTT